MNFCVDIEINNTFVFDIAVWLESVSYLAVGFSKVPTKQVELFVRHFRTELTAHSAICSIDVYLYAINA